MSLGDVVRIVAELQRNIDQQNQQIHSFGRHNQDNIALVTTELQGSRRGHDVRMLSSLNDVGSSLRRSSDCLQKASQALARIQLI